jgi:hypothetical protein
MSTKVANQRRSLIRDYVEAFHLVDVQLSIVHNHSQYLASHSPETFSLRLTTAIERLVEKDMLHKDAVSFLAYAVIVPPTDALFVSCAPDRFKPVSQLVRNVHYDIGLRILKGVDNIANYLVSPNRLEREFATAVCLWLKGS